MLLFRKGLPLAALIAILFVPASATAQTFGPPAGVGSVTFAWQWIDNTGHISTDGTFFPKRKSETTGILAEVDYGVTERLAATVAIPFVFARYTGDAADARFPSEVSRSWQQSFQDFSVAARYRLGDDFRALTPQVRVIIPSHDYPYAGEAVVGPNLNQVLLGISGAWRFTALPKASLQAAYSFALVEKAVEDLRPNRSNLSMSVGYRLTRSLYVHGGALLQKTHGGLTAQELFDPNTPLDLKAQADRIVKARYWHMTGGLSYELGVADLFFSVEPYVWGRDAHDGIAYTVGSTWYFDWSRKGP